MVYSDTGNFTKEQRHLCKKIRELINAAKKKDLIFKINKNKLCAYLLDEIEFAIDNIKFLGCRGTTGTEASFVDLFDGDASKIDEMNKQIAAEICREQSDNKCCNARPYTARSLDNGREGHNR